jgi:hypothetical protein
MLFSNILGLTTSVVKSIPSLSIGNSFSYYTFELNWFFCMGGGRFFTWFRRVSDFIYLRAVKNSPSYCTWLKRACKKSRIPFARVKNLFTRSCIGINIDVKNLPLPCKKSIEFKCVVLHFISNLKCESCKSELPIVFFDNSWMSLS